MAAHIVRMLCDSKDSSRTVKDAATGHQPFWWRGSDLRFQLALTRRGTFLSSSEVGTITLEVKSVTATPDDGALMLVTKVAADCNAGFVPANWAAGTDQLLNVDFTPALSALEDGLYRLIVRHTDSTGKKDTHLSTTIRVIEDQAGDEGTPLALPGPSDWLTAKAVRFDMAQTLTAGERAQARANQGITVDSNGKMTVVTASGTYEFYGSLVP